MTIKIDHLIETGRFQAVIDGIICLLDYRLNGQIMTITHTEVPSKLGGRGLAGELMKAAIDYARQQGFRVSPRCSYAVTYMDRHLETGDVRVF